ncbi:MAG TPA: Ni/Fe-hydrogenase, b-type cytochrome subunit [Thermoleophilia bacterium]|nr:Ni/Fe-hydrogenase, b-type cytochrome subunit [Thermoleophilia bacterium]
MAVRTTRAEHPLAAVVTHWLHVVALFVLVWTGFFIHSPFYNASFALHRNIHLVAAFVLIFTGISRIYWAFFGEGSADVGSKEKICDCRFFLPDKLNRGKLWQMIKYYMFLRKTHPRTAKYNPLQKLAYLALLVAMLVMLVTGLEMWTHTKEFLQPLTYFLGGPLVVRFIHYFSMWLFMVVTATHIYLTFAETPWEVPLMFWWKEARFVGRDGETVPARKSKERGA